MILFFGGFEIYLPLVVFKVYFVGKSTTQLTPIQSQPASRDRCGNNRKCDNIDKRAHQSAGIKKQNLCYTMTFLWQYLEDWRNNLLLQSGSNKTVLSNSMLGMVCKYRMVLIRKSTFCPKVTVHKDQKSPS